MSRVRRGTKARRRRNKILSAARGFRGGRSKLYRSAVEAVHRGWSYAYRDRHNRKRDMRRLWIVLINAAAREHGITYSRLINGLNKAGVEVNRKMLADMAISDTLAFAKLAEVAKTTLAA